MRPRHTNRICLPLRSCFSSKTMADIFYNMVYNIT